MVKLLTHFTVKPDIFLLLRSKSYRHCLLGINAETGPSSGLTCLCEFSYLCLCFLQKEIMAQNPTNKYNSDFNFRILILCQNSNKSPNIVSFVSVMSSVYENNNDIRFVNLHFNMLPDLFSRFKF